MLNKTRKRYKASEFCKMIGISVRTLDRRVASGQIVPIIDNKHRYFTDEHIKLFVDEELPTVRRKTIAYARVSSHNQKNELLNQLEALEKYSINSGIIIDDYLHDIGSGINYKRKNFLKLLEMIISGEVGKIVITYKDRMVRFAFELIEWLCKMYDVEIVVINLRSTSIQEELVEDLMTIIHVFSSRLYGLRRYKKEIKDALSYTEDKDKT